MKKYISIITVILILAISSCKDDEPTLGEAPTTADAEFTYTISTTSNNIINFKANRSDVVAVWDFGNETSSKGSTGTGVYPNAGTYTVKLTIFSKGGSASTSQDINIVADDPTLLSDPLFTMLTGGVDSLNGKTWVLDSAYAGHFGVGPNPPSSLGLIPEWYAAAANEKSATGLYNDEYVFNIQAFGFDMITNGLIYVHTDFKDNFAGSYQEKGDFNAPYPNQTGESWKLEYAAGSDTTITISGNAFIGMNTNVQKYRILSITDDVMNLRYLHDGNPMLSWYLRLVRKGYDSGAGGGSGGGGSTGASLPIDFETSSPTFETFGGSTANVISNPDIRGINTSANVLETVHGNETWAGVSVELDNKLDFSNDSSIVVKIWAPNAGKLLIKLEDKNNSMVSIEDSISVPVAFTWIERKINFGSLSAASNTYDKIALFPGWGVASNATFYLDDIRQE